MGESGFIRISSFSVISIKKLIFHMPQFIGQIHMNLVGIYKTLGLVPQVSSSFLQ